MRKIISPLFLKNWRLAFDNYITGFWYISYQWLLKCKKINPGDGPTSSLLRILKRHKYISPEDWQGYRKLIRK